MYEDLTILSMEQATVLPFLTQRLAAEGARVIRLEDPRRGDPNRYIGTDALGEEGMRTYFLPNNLGKEAITLDLSREEGRALLADLVAKLPVDVFATNVRPRSYRKLGLDEETLRRARPDLIWLGITGYGPDHEEPAYDPVLQARSGMMELNGEKGGPPIVMGVPMIDLGTSEVAYGQIAKALYRRARTGQGSRIDLSMFACALGWMASPILHAGSFGHEVTRRGNTHPYFGPASVFPASDGHVYVAVGSDHQWAALVGAPEFAGLDRPEWAANAGRIAAVAEVGRLFAERTSRLATARLLEVLREAGVPASAIAPLRGVVEDPLVRASLVRAKDPASGVEIAVPGPPVASAFLEGRERRLSFPPRLGEHGAKVLEEVGVTRERFAELRGQGIV